MGTIKVKAHCLKQVYKNGDYVILSFNLLEPNENIQLSTYGSFSCKGEYPFISEGKDYEMELEIISNHQSYGSTCKILAVPSLEQLDFKNLSKEESFEILMDCTSSERVANNILGAYPNFIELVLTEGKEAIDTDKIVGVGDIYLNAYVRELTNKYKYYHLLKAFKDYKVDITDCKSLCDIYKDEQGIRKALKYKPYTVLCDVLKRKFEQADELVMEFQDEFRESNHRCEYLILDVLMRNEEGGSTRLNGNSLYYYIEEESNKPELLPLVVETVKESELIYYDEETKDVSIMVTYLGETYISDFIKDKIKKSKKLNIDWTKYTQVGDFKMSEKQAECLKMFCENNVSVLAGYSGCVDMDTEFFNGKQWKKISEYNENDLVLQYHTDGSATLVKPDNYIKLPCDYLWHFETKYGLSQTLSDEHRVIYYSSKGVFKENTLSEIMEIHKNNKSGFCGKIPTTFNYEGNGIELTDNEIKIMCAVICDGSFYAYATDVNCKTHYKCRFHIKKDRKKEALRELFTKSDIWWEEKVSSAEGYSDFYINAPRREKEFTEYWYNCNHHQLQIICDNIMQWDGSNNITLSGKDRFKFSTVIKQTADFIQFAYSSCGFRSSISVNNRIGRAKINKGSGKTYYDKSMEYSVGITKVIKCSIMNDHNKTEFIKVIPKDGFKYCFTVDSGMLVLRKDNKIFCTGNSGKSTSVQGLISLMEDNGLSYTLLTPTGSASKRLSEVTHRDCSTIHRKCMRDGEIWSDVVLIDETSMVDLSTMIMLFQTIKNEKARIVFVGDPAQLSSVGIGTLFSDIIDSNITPKIELTEIFRYNSSGSLYTATNIRLGRSFFNNTDSLIKRSSDKNTLMVGNNYKFIQTEDIMNTLLEEYSKLISKGFKPKDILVLSPQNIGSIGTYELNNIIQSEINPIKPNEITLSRKINITEIRFKLGDMVLNKKNDYKALPYDSWKIIENGNGMLNEEDVPLTQVYNGEKGIIREIDDKKLVIEFDNDLIVFNKTKIKNLLLSYVRSVHSVQGNEAKAVINIVSPTHSRMLTRNLEYVATTRSKEIHVDIGDMSAFENALLVEEMNERSTWLKDLLLKEEK